MKLQRGIANFLIRTCGLRRLHGSGLQKTVRTFLDEIDLEHLRETYPCKCCADRHEFYQCIESTLIGGEAIDFLEFGVYQGESIREWNLLNKHPESRFFGFDSFEGLPESWRESQEKGHFSLGGALPEVEDRRTTLVKGWFDKTVPQFAKEFVPRNRLVLHLDADLYTSTLLPLVYLSPFLVPGSVLIFDEFYDRDHEFKAFCDYLKLSKAAFRACCQMDDYGKVSFQLL